MKAESASGLRKLLETINEHLRALNDLGQPTNQWDAILVFWISEKMDFESRKQWQLSNPGTDLFSWDQLAEVPEVGLLSVALQLRLKQPSTKMSSRAAATQSRAFR